MRTTPTEVKSPKALAMFERAAAVLPGGNTRTQLFVPPHPLYVERAQGAVVTLIDGRQLDDFLMNYTAAACGYNHPEILKSVSAALSLGGPFGMPTEWEILLAEVLQRRVPALERVRFTNSGSEATLHAIRAARAYTGRSTIAKAEGAYHGSYDVVDFSIARLAEEPLGVVPETPGVPAPLADTIVLLPYNDLEVTRAVLDEHSSTLATVILEPFLNSAGCIPGDSEYIKGVADWCVANDVLFTFDEVASFRTSYAGAQTDFDVTPDIVCLGKAIGGGFAIGAFGGREDVMSAFDPRTEGHIRHAGTFNGHPVTMAAGIAALELLDETAIELMNRRCARLLDGIRQIGIQYDIPLTATGYGSIGNMHMSRTPPRSARDSLSFPRESRLDLFWRLIDRGFIVAPRLQFSISLVTTDDQVDRFLLALEDALAPGGE